MEQRTIRLSRMGARGPKWYQWFREHYFAAYTLAFAAAALLVYAVFLFEGKTFIWDHDGWKQHYPALVYYGRWLRACLKALFLEHSLALPTYSFSLGYGSDIIETLSYYVIGDPFTLGTVFVPERYTEYYYTAMILLRLYCAGVAFSVFCRYMRRRSARTGAGRTGNMAILAGSLVYVFCGFTLISAVRHPYFVNPMIYFPLLLLGVERVLDHRRPTLLIVMAFLAGISNFYFLYSLTILTLAYLIWKLVLRYASHRAWKAALRAFVRCAAGVLLGLAMSALLLLPTLWGFFGSERLQQHSALYPLYSLQDYTATFRLFLGVAGSNHHWTCLGYAGAALLAVVLLFLRPGYRRIKAVLLVLTAMLLIPAAGYLMNGCAYVSNRWVWACSFLIAYILVLMWKRLFLLSQRESGILAAVLALYLILCMLLPESRSMDAYFGLMTAILSLLIAGTAARLRREQFARIARRRAAGTPPTAAESAEEARLRTMRRAAPLLLTVCILFNLGGNALLLYAPQNSSYAEEFIPRGGLYADWQHRENYAVRAAAGEDHSFYRFAAEPVTNNNALLSGLHGINYYWSLENGYVSAFRNEQAVADTPFLQDYHSLDGRAFLETLANVKYHVESGRAPYGFAACKTVWNYRSMRDCLRTYCGADATVDSISDEQWQYAGSRRSRYQVWKNRYALPFGYTYRRCIPASSYRKMSAVQRQEAMLQGVVLRDADTDRQAVVQPTFTSRRLPFQVTAAHDASVSDSRITAAKNGAEVILRFDGLENAETYLYFDDLSYSRGRHALRSVFDPTSEPSGAAAPPSREEASPRDEGSACRGATGARSTPQAVSRLRGRLSLRFTANGRDGSRVEKKLLYLTRESQFYGGRHDFLVNFGTSSDGQVSITIKLPKAGVYRFSKLQVLCQPMKNYPRQTAALAESAMEHVDFHENSAQATGEVSGCIRLRQPRYLLLTIPWTNGGWTATVDGRPAKLLQANTMFTALRLSSGTHRIVLRYHTPGLRAGILISLAAWAVFIGWLLRRRRRRGRAAGK